MHALQRWWHGRRARSGPYAALFEPAPRGALVAIDLETTGLDTARCGVLSLAAVAVEGNRVRTSTALSLHVRGSTEIPLESMRHHRLRPSDVAGGVALDEALARLVAFVGGRPLLGYCVGFDVAVIERELARRGGPPLPNRRLELMDEFERRYRRAHPEREPELAFEAIARTLGIPQLGRHDALCDAVTAALCYVRLAAGGPFRGA